MLELGLSGSARGAPSDGRPYRNPRPRADLAAAPLEPLKAPRSRNFGDFHQPTAQPAMGDIFVDARMPYGDYIEIRNIDRRLEHNQPPIVVARDGTSATRSSVCNISGRSRKLGTE